jgi:tellurite resistance protein TerC
VLAFVGLKMVWLNDLYDGKFPITWSLLIIAATIAISIVLSILIPPKHPETLDQAA